MCRSILHLSLKLVKHSLITVIKEASDWEEGVIGDGRERSSVMEEVSAGVWQTLGARRERLGVVTVVSGGS